jgi:hypothetical protein
MLLLLHASPVPPQHLEPLLALFVFMAFAAVVVYRRQRS